MKTKVRIQRGKSGTFETLIMQILQPCKYGRYLAPIGHISWQGDAKHQWYAMRFNVDADLSDHARMLTMYKLACYIKERCDGQSPIEVMGIIGGEECVYDYGMYIPISENGKIVFNVRADKGGGVHTRVIAINGLMAQRIVEGMIARKELNIEIFSLDHFSSRLAYKATDLNFATTPENQSTI
jgi:hypothetical protein